MNIDECAYVGLIIIYLNDRKKQVDDLIIKEDNLFWPMYDKFEFDQVHIDM